MATVGEETRSRLSAIRPRCVLTPEHARLRDAAIDYVAHGWGVLPVSACDGQSYYRGHTRQRVDALAPVMPSGRTLREARAVWSRWHLGPYGVAARTGDAPFDVIAAPTWLAVLATARPEFRHRFGPVAVAPSGARLLVGRGARLRPELSQVRGVRVGEPGTLVPLPPTRLLAGQVTWWITPDQVDWRLGDAETVQDALCAALASADDEVGGAGEARA